MNDKGVFRLVWTISIIVLLVIIILQAKIVNIFPNHDVLPAWVQFLPRLNAMINGTCAVLLITSFYFIIKKNIRAHKVLNITALILSSLFLISYLIFHSAGVETKFGGVGFIRYVYYFILITHIILAAIVLPLVLMSFYRGMKMQVERHRKLVRWTFPIWLYVTISGVLVYLMISPYYSF
jgi:putative membrane protein